MLHSLCCNSKTFRHLKSGQLVRKCCECQKPCKVWQGKVTDSPMVISGWHDPEVEIEKASKNISRLFVVFIFLFLVFILLAFKGIIYYMKLPL